MRRPHRLQRPGAADAIAARHLEADARMVPRELRAGDLLHGDTGGPVAIGDSAGSLEAGLVFRDEQVTYRRELEGHRSLRKLLIDRRAGVEHLDHLRLRTAEQGAGVASRRFGGNDRLFENDRFDASGRQLPGQRATGDATADDDGVDRSVVGARLLG